MYLVYTDETGTNNNNNVIFSMYGGLIVHESSVLKFEMQITEIVQEFLGFANMLLVEVHFTEIFNYLFLSKKPTNKSKAKYFDEEVLPLIRTKSKEDLIQFVDELFQLISKANIPFLYMCVDKRDDFHKNHYLNNEEISHNAYAFKGFLNILDRFLTQKQEMGLLIADDFANQIPKNLKKLSNIDILKDETIKSNPNVKEIVYKRVLAESLVWKNKFLNGSISSNTIAPLKYKFESNSFNIIDNINFVSSKDSILNQVSDILLYVLRRVKEYNSDKSKYSHLEDFCKNKDLLTTISFLYKSNIIIEGQTDIENDVIDIALMNEFE